jgi:hypothetical protein
LSIDTQRLSKTISLFIFNAAQVQTPTGKYRLRSGRLFFIALNKVNHSEKSQGILTYRMRLYGVFFGLLVENSKRVNQTF